MKKTLISLSQIQTTIASGSQTYAVPDTAHVIITPAAKDLIKAHNILVVAESPSVANSHCNSDKHTDPDKLSQLLQAIIDQGLLQELLQALNLTTPYQSVRDPSGLKLIRGESVSITKPLAHAGKDVHYQELVHPSECSHQSGLLTVKGTSDPASYTSNLTLYVGEGALTATVNGKPFTAGPGDTLFIPQGTCVVFSSTHAKAFYTR